MQHPSDRSSRPRIDVGTLEAVALAGDLQTQQRPLSQGTTGRLAAEFQAATRAIVGVATRATMDLHEATRTQQWAQGLLTPEGSRPVSPSTCRSSSVNAVPRLILGLVSTALPRTWTLAVTPCGDVVSS